ncbi:MAG: glycosyltransferase [bacterium]
MSPPKPKLSDYAAVVGNDVIDHLHQLARSLAGTRVIHVNSTRQGGGVAEILERLVPLMTELGIDASWEVIQGSERFFECTKNIHNGLQGNPVDLSPKDIEEYEAVNQQNAAALHSKLVEADVVFIHDPQPAALLHHVSKRRGKWIWRCHIDVSNPHRSVWRYVRKHVAAYDASIWSLATFAQPLPHLQYLIPPSIDPLSEKNIPLEEAEVDTLCAQFGVDLYRPLLLQVSRFDRFKDPIGVIAAYRLVKKYVPSLQLVLAGGSATDDPEGESVLREVHDAAQGDRNIGVLVLPSDAHRTINALQRAADIVLQKSTREGFGLTVTEALWKRKPVIGGRTGGIELQVINHHTGFLVNSSEGAALRIRYLLDNREKMLEMGAKGHRFVLENFLITRHLRDYLTMMIALLRGAQERIEL